MPITAQSTYDIIKELGRGRMAVVYLAKNRNNGHLSVLKVFYTLSGASALDLVNREAQIQRRLDHPGIVRVSGIAQDVIIPNNPGKHYALVMEYVAGQDLGAYLQRKKRLSVEETIRISIQICRALEYAHTKGIIHRDIKPQNVLVRNDGAAKITDFGFASATSSSILSLSGIVGTPYYISPEQAKGDKGDQKSDIYSVGVMMYEMLCGTVPFQGSHPSVVIDRHRTEIPKRISESVSSVPAQLDDFVLKTLEKRPNDRFHSAGEMAVVLERIAGELEIQLQTSSWKDRATTFYYKTIDNITANTVWWLFSVVVAFLFTVIINNPRNLAESTQLLMSIAAPFLSPSAYAAQVTPDVPPSPLTRISATPTYTPAPRPTATRTPTPPPNVTCESDKCHPEPGYSWVDKDNESDMHVVWEPGKPHPDFLHISAADEEGYWDADPGYSFPDQNSLRVVWEPGRRHPDFPHISAADREGYWDADPGYEFVDPQNSLRVVWKSGVRHPDNPYTFAAKQEGKWVIGTINSVSVDHGVFQNGVKGMTIHVNFDIDNLAGEDVRVIAYFYYENGEVLKDINNSYNTSEGQVAIGDKGNLPYEGTSFEDFRLFMPSAELDLGNCTCDLKFKVQLQTSVGTLAESEFVHFSYRGQ